MDNNNNNSDAVKASSANNPSMDIWEKVFLAGKEDDNFLQKFGIKKLKKR